MECVFMVETTDYRNQIMLAPKKQEKEKEKENKEMVLLE